MITVNKILNFAVAQFHCFQLYQSLVLLFIFPLIMSVSTYLYLFTFCCVCFHIVGANTYCVVFLFCLSLSCVLLPVSLDCPFLIDPWGFSNVYSIWHYPKLETSNRQSVCIVAKYLFSNLHVVPSYHIIHYMVTSNILMKKYINSKSTGIVSSPKSLFTECVSLLWRFNLP